MINRCPPDRRDLVRDEKRRKQRRQAFAASLIVAGLCSFGFAAHSNTAQAQDLAAYSVVPQFGHSSAPTAIVIAPNGRWFATATEAEIDLWDMMTGDILRRIASPSPIKFLTLSRDGRLVLVRDAADRRSGWSAETGVAVSTADATSAEAAGWSDLEHFGEGRLFLFKDDEARKYLARMGIEQLVPVSKEYQVMATNEPDVVEVDFNADADPIDPTAGPGLGAAFVNVGARKLLAKYVPTPDEGDCGRPWGTFAFDGRNLVLAPSEKDASSFFSAAEVIDVAASPPKLKWMHECRDFMVSSIEMRNGLIVARPDPSQAILWDSASGQALARLKDISPAPRDGRDVAISNDRGTIAYAHSVEAREHGYGVSVLRGGASKLLATDRQVADVRLSADGLTVFGETSADWKAWNAQTGQPLRGDIKPPDAPEHFADARFSPDGRFQRVAVKPNGARRQSSIVDSLGHAVITVEGRLFFSEDSLHAWSLSNTQEQSVDLWDLKTGKRIWTATDDQGDLVIEFPDGRVRLSKGAEKRVRLVLGFHARPFDSAADRLFIER